MQSTRAVLRLGDRVVFDGAEHTVAGLAGTSVRLVSVSGQPSVVLLSHLLASPGFELVGSSPMTGLAGIGLLERAPRRSAATGQGVGAPRHRGGYRAAPRCRCHGPATRRVRPVETHRPPAGGGQGGRAALRRPADECGDGQADAPPLPGPGAVGAWWTSGCSAR